jgi:hypothetical protein
VGHGAAGRSERVPLDVEGDRAGATRRRSDPHPLAPGVDRHRQAEFGRGLEDREVARLAVGPFGAAAEEDVYEAGILGDSPDLLGRLLRILRRADNRAAQAHIALEPAIPDPVVVRASERCRAVGARHQRDEHGVVGVQHSGGGPAGIEQLSLHGLHIRSRQAAVGREVLPVPGRRMAPRVAREPEVRLAAEPVPLPRLNVGEEFLGISDLRMDVAVDHVATRSRTRRSRLYGSGTAGSSASISRASR